MKPLLQHLLLVCLLAPSQDLSAQTRNPYDFQLDQLASRFASAGKLHKLVLLNQIFVLRDYVNGRARLDAWLSTVTTASSEAEVVRREASALSAEIRRDNSAITPHWYRDEEARRQIFTEARQLTSAGTAESYEVLAELEHMAGLPEAAEHMEHAARIFPSAERWQRTARLTEDTFRKFAALESGLALDPGNSQLNLQLAAYYVGRNQLEKARDLFVRAIAAEPGDFVARERLAELYLGLGLRSQTLRDLKELERQCPDPLWLRARLAINYEQLGLLEDAAQLARSVLAESKDRPELLELLARFHESRHMPGKLADDYLELSRLQPRSVDLWRKLARLQLDSGDLNAARASLLRLLSVNGNAPEAHRLLAEVYHRLHMETEARQERLAATRAVEAAAGPHAGNSAADSEFMADAGTLAKAAFLHPPESSDIALADIRVQQLYANGLDRVHVQQVFFIGSDAALEAHRLTSIQYSPSSEALQILHARSWKPNGQVLDAQDLGDRQPADSSVSMYYDRRTRQLRLPGLERGDVVEIEYALSPVLGSSPYGSYFGELVFFAGQNAAALKRYVLIAPAAQTLHAHAEKVRPATVLARGDSRIFVWESRDVPALVREPRSPGITELAPYVHVSTFANWQELGAWYADLVRPQFALDLALQEALSRLLEGKHSDREKIAAIRDFVLRSTHYLAQEFGVYTYKPYPVAQTYARRFGDCKDKASLMIALLRAAGIEAQLALLRTRSLGAVAVQPASIALFDHAIVYIPKYNLWLDATAEYAVHELPLQDQGALALTVGLDGAAQLRHTPMSRAGDNYTKHTIHAQLTAQGMIRFSGSTAARGEDAPGLRQELSLREQQLDSLRRDLAQVFPSVRLYSVDVRDREWTAGEMGGSEISVAFRGDLNSFQQKRVVSLGSSWMPRSYVAALAPSGSRSEDLMLFAPWTTEEEIHIELPAGARVTELPYDKNLTAIFGSMKLRYRKSSDEIVVQSHVQFDKARVPAADYAAFHEFCIQMERNFHEEIKVELTP